MDAAVEDRLEVIITRTTGDQVIMLDRFEYEAMMETFHLLRLPRNAERLREIIADVEVGTGVEATLVDGAIGQCP